MILAEITLTTETIIFIGTVITAVIAVVFYFAAIDKRVAILENNTINKEEFYQKMDEFKKEIVDGVREEIKNCKLTHD